MRTVENWDNKIQLQQGTRPVGKKYLNLFLVSRQVSNEAQDVFWSKVVLVLWTYDLKHRGLNFEPNVWRNIRLVAIDGALCKLALHRTGPCTGKGMVRPFVRKHLR